MERAYVIKTYFIETDFEESESGWMWWDMLVLDIQDL